MGSGGSSSPINAPYGTSGDERVADSVCIMDDDYMGKLFVTLKDYLDKVKIDCTVKTFEPTIPERY